MIPLTNPTHSQPVVLFKPPSPRIKPIFPKQVSWRCLMPSDMTAIAKRKPKILPSIKLSSLHYLGFSLCMIRSLCRTIKDAKLVSSIRIQKDEIQQQKSRQLRHLLHTLARVKKLVVSYTYDDEDMEKALSRVRRLKDLSSLEVHFFCDKETRERILPCLLKEMKGLNKLKALNFYLNKCSYDLQMVPRTYEPNALLFKYKYPISLESLSIRFNQTKLPDSKLVFSFASNLSQCISLKSLSLDFSEVLTPYNLSELQIWASLLQKAKNIKTMKITKIWPTFVRAAEMQPFLQAFQYMKNLTALELKVTFLLSENLPKEFPKSFFSHLASLTNLKSLKLECSGLLGLQSPDIFLCFGALQHLQQLLIRLQAPFTCQKDTIHLKSLFEALGSLKKLKSFEAYLPDHEVSSQNCEVLSQSLKQLSALQALSLTFHRVNNPDVSLDILSQLITRLKLKSLVLNLRKNNHGYDNISNKEINKKGNEQPCETQTPDNFSLLSNLDLRLSTFNLCTKQFNRFSIFLRQQLSSVSLEVPQFGSILLSSLKDMKKLDSLQLTLKGPKLCEAFAENIGHFRHGSLRALKLCFDSSKDLSENSILRLALRLRSLLSLKKLTIEFGKEKTVEEKTMLEFVNTFICLKNLEKIVLKLRSYPISMNFRNLVLRLSGRQNLRKLFIGDYEWI